MKARRDKRKSLHRTAKHKTLAPKTEEVQKFPNKQHEKTRVEERKQAIDKLNTIFSFKLLSWLESGSDTMYSCPVCEELRKKGIQWIECNVWEKLLHTNC